MKMKMLLLALALVFSVSIASAQSNKTTKTARKSAKRNDSTKERVQQAGMQMPG